MKEILKNKYVLGLLSILGLITAIIPILGSYFWPIDVDSAIILTEMERIFEGFVPYKTMHLNYPPLWFYINVALKWLFHVPYGCYYFYLTIHWLYVAGIATCLYSLSKHFNTNKVVAWFVAWLYIIVSHWLQGNEILFEIPSVFWGMLAITLAYKWEDKHPALYIIVGMLACSSFFTKQFGAGFSLLVAWIVVARQTGNKWKQIGFYVLGYIIPLVVCYLCWGWDIYQCILFNGYGTNLMDAYWGRVTTPMMKFERMFEHILHFTNRVAPIIYAALFLSPIIFKQGKWREFLLCIFALGGFLLQFWFVHGGNHYYQYLVPFALLLIPICLSLELNKYIRYVLYGFIMATVAFSGYSTYRNRVWKGFIKSGNKQQKEQIAFGHKISEMIGDGKTVYIAHGGIDYLYYTANLYPPCMQKYGYAVGPMEINIEGCAEMVEKADYVLRFSKEMMLKIYPDGRDFEYYFTDSIQSIVAQYPSDTLDERGDIILHRMYLPKVVSND